MKKALCILYTLLCCVIANGMTSVMAAEQSVTKEEVLEIAFNRNVPELSQLVMIDDLDESMIVFDSRFDSASDAVITPRAVPSSYDYYRTYNTGVTCKGTGAAGSSQLNVNINFYINVFFKLNSSYNGYCVGYENPVITGVVNHYGATGYSNPKVSVTSWSSSRINFKGSYALTADSTFTMIGTNSLNVT